MSVKVMSYVWDIPTFKGSDKLIMLCLADFADDAGLCWPSIDTISRKSGVSATTVKSAVKKLVDGGWLSKRNQSRVLEGGKRVRTNNQYQLQIAKLKRAADEWTESAQTETEQANPVQTDSVRTESDPTELDQTKFEQAENTKGVGQNPAGGRSKSDYDPSIDPPIDPSCNSALSEPLDAEPALFKIPLNRKNEFHGVTQPDINEYSDLYGSVDVRAELKKMIAWCDSNPRKRKTKQGVQKFIHGWLSRSHDNGRFIPGNQQAQEHKPVATDVDKLKDEIRELQMNLNNENEQLLRVIEFGGTQAAIDASKKSIAAMSKHHRELMAQLNELESAYA